MTTRMEWIEAREASARIIRPGEEAPDGQTITRLDVSDDALAELARQGVPAARIATIRATRGDVVPHDRALILGPIVFEGTYESIRRLLADATAANERMGPA